MPKQRESIRMTPEEIDSFLGENGTLQVASINADGSPHLVAMWFAFHEGRIGFWTYAKSQKVVNLRRDSRLTVMVESGKYYEELRGVTMYGHGLIVEESEEVLRFGEVLVHRYWGPIESDTARAMAEKMGAKRVLILVDPFDVLSWDHTKLVPSRSD